MSLFLVTLNFAPLSLISFLSCSVSLTVSPEYSATITDVAFEKFKIIGGGYNGEKIDKEKIDFLAKLPSLNELRGKIIGLISAPAQKIASITIEPGAQIARLISSNSSNKQESN